MGPENGKAGQRQEVAPRLSVVVWRPPREGTRRAAGLGRSLGSPAQGHPDRRRDIGGRAVAQYPGLSVVPADGRDGERIWECNRQWPASMQRAPRPARNLWTQ